MSLLFGIRIQRSVIILYDMTPIYLHHLTGAEKSTVGSGKLFGPTLLGAYSVVHGAFLLVHVALVVGFVMVTLCGTGVLDAVASA